MISSPLRWKRIKYFTFFCIPLVILTAAYVWLAVHHRSLFLSGVRVHESGRYTLLQTVLYFSHFLREVPIDVGMALFLLEGFASRGGIRARHVAASGPPRALSFLSLASAFLLIGIAFLAAARREGAAAAVHDLFQFRTRDDLSDYGSHWRFHWLSLLWMGVAAPLAADLLAWCSGRAFMAPRQRERVLAAAAWGYFALLTVVFGFSEAIFLDPWYVGHQAREILTHSMITSLLTIGVLDAVARWLTVPLPTARDDEASRRTQSLRWLRMALLLAIPGYLAILVLSKDGLVAAQSGGALAPLLAGHFFEHVLDYLLVLLLALGGYGLMLSRRTQPA